MKTTTMRIGVAALAATAFAAGPSRDDAARIKDFAELYQQELISKTDFDNVVSEILGKAPAAGAPEPAARRQLQDNSDVAQSKCLASMMADTADMAQECMDGIRTATNPAVTGIIQFLSDNLEIPACPECPSMVMSGDGAFPPCGALAARYDEMPIEHNCPTEYPFMKAGTGCNAQCTNGPERFSFYCPPDNNQAMQEPIAVVPQWAIDEGFDAWAPRCCAGQPNCANPHTGYKCASMDIDLVMCFEARAGYFVQENFVVNECAEVCVTCWGSSDKRCLDCYDGYYYDTDIINFPQTSQYLHESEEGDYTYATCTRCDNSCHTCDGPGPENCLHRVCHEDYCQGENMVLVEGWEEIMCHRDDCEILQNGRRAMVSQNGRRSLQSGEDVCCVEREPCNINACVQPQFELFRDGSAENILCAGPECQPEVDNDTCCELAFEQCNENACRNLYYPREDADQRWCASYPCTIEDNDHCCSNFAWMDYSGEFQFRREGKNGRMYSGGWDGARMTEWFTEGRHDVTIYFDYSQSGTSSMMGVMRRYGSAYWSHMHSDNPNDGHPDGYAFYTDSGPYNWYGGASWSHVDGCCYGWYDGDYLRIELDVDERWIKWYLTKRDDSSIRDRHWGSASSIDCNTGCAIGGTPDHDGQRLYAMDDEIFRETMDINDYRYLQVFDDWELTYQLEYSQRDGHYIDWGGNDDRAGVETNCFAPNGSGNEDNLGNACRDRKTLTHYHHGRWYSWRTSMWKTYGYSSITYNVNYFYQYGMVGVIRGDYVRYYNHMHSGGQGDEHPDGWNWHADNGGFNNYSPWNGNFYHDRGDIGAYNTDDQLRFDMDFRGNNRIITCWLNSENRGYDWVQVARWTDIDFGNKGGAFGGSWHDGYSSGVGDSMTVIDIYWDQDISYDDAIASGYDNASSPGSGVDENEREGGNRRSALEGGDEAHYAKARRARYADIKAGTHKKLF